MSANPLRLFTPLALVLLAGCATSPFPAKPPATSLASAATSTKPDHVRLPNPREKPISLRTLYRQTEWASQERMDQVLAVACLHRTQYRLIQTAPTWSYVGDGAYRRNPVNLAQAPTCWDALAHVFESQERGAVQALGTPWTPVAQYYRASTAWALYCEQVSVTPTGLQKCVSPGRLAEIKMAKANALRYLHR